ncbi:DNA cytosine methyltransferase [Paracoccus cavernae]|uniref:DNA (cytosine-5-)-methyltransferase n=1 Tax=Paracoccus cavernae TaxID=1571207 RepID=A0ABT8D621_9RHOB|nr:DNA cytosine methyltransferase [Paracoccus cavernae]
MWDVEPLTVTQGRHVGLLWASPDCKHFSKAKGGAPRDRNIRDLAWVVVRWAKWAKPDVICMENVEEFTTWGPVDNDGQPIKEFAGQTFDDFINGLKAAGYRVQWRELRACDYGAPTIASAGFLLRAAMDAPSSGQRPRMAILHRQRSKRASSRLGSAPTAALTGLCLAPRSSTPAPR